ncbi:hypothetical protein HMN09_01041900 [Mycena chlorophos]|uniref:Asparaginase n=1 Tax=Mycena chlorophos TaxID=658473 RepID=A0A8H6SG80_MYCCL|nr:hypothetical protein HMN09_01041900 [Mycena chlorophos]
MTLLVVHGGAGTMSRPGSTPEQRANYRAAIRKALLAGNAVLSAGGEAMDAAAAAVRVFEDNPLFNAGKGAVFNVAGKNELEASLMLSKPPASHPHIPTSRRGVGMTLLTHVRNPSSLARALYLAPDVLPTQLVPESYFFTRARWIEHRRGLGLPEGDEKDPEKADDDEIEDFPLLDLLPTGTVGAVALDSHGCIASMTSTGGRTNKLVGRIGDTPHMGSGFWAEQWNTTSWVHKVLGKMWGTPSQHAVGVSGTGDGDASPSFKTLLVLSDARSQYFIRFNTAATIAHRVRYLGESLQAAADFAVKELAENGGIGGVIALDNHHNAVFALNCPGMYRGVIHEDGIPKTAIFDDDVLE